MNGAQILITMLERQGITTIAGIPGGANLPVYDALHNSTITHILPRHEQGGGFIAHGMARSTGSTAACLATSGPGATNLVTAIADAKADSVPVLFITGQVPESLSGTDAFQEVDIIAICRPITKKTYRPKTAAELYRMVPDALYTAADGRPGPVLMDIPKNIQLEEAAEQVTDTRISMESHMPLNYAAFKQAAAMLNAAERPVFYIGGGMVTSGAHRILRVMARKTGIPVVSTLMGLGAFPGDDELFLGMVGMHGSERANRAIAAADLVIAAGARFDDRATGPAGSFCPDAAVIHIDIDQNEPGRLNRADCALHGDCSEVLRELNRRTRSGSRNAWHTRIRTFGPNPRQSQTPAHRYIKAISSIVTDDTIITTDVGQHQMWAAQAYPVVNPRTFLTSGSMGTMGFGLPAAIGAALAHPDKRIVCFSGDGSIMMNIQELATLAEHGLNVTVILFDNNCLGMVRQQQEMFYGNRTVASRFSGNPDFTALAASFGIRAKALMPALPAEPQLRKVLQGAGPSFIIIPIAEEDNVYPTVKPGCANTEMITAESTNKQHQ